MEKVRIGVICPSEIAFRRFMPAVQKCDGIQYVGVACADQEEWFGGKAEESVITAEREKAEKFTDSYGGTVFPSYKDLIKSEEIDAVYLPLPPALHYEWAKIALESGKHVFLEKPSTTSAKDTRELVELARKKDLALHENYMFIYHDQLKELKRLEERIGEVRLYRIAFGFPRRSKNDFRYNKALGGGALLDCGGYTLKLASMLLGESSSEVGRPEVKVACASLNHTPEFEVDLYGSATLINDAGTTAQISFGMDNSYKCELEIWGSKGFITTGRVFTAPAGVIPTAEITFGNEREIVELPADDTFVKSITQFQYRITNQDEKEKTYQSLIWQAELVDRVRNFGSLGKTL